MRVGVASLDVNQLFVDDLKRILLGSMSHAGALPDGEAVAQERDGGASRLAEVIYRLAWHDHFRLERDFVNGLVTDSVEHPADVVVVSRLIPNPQR